MAHSSSGPRGQLWVRAWLHRVCDLDTVGKGKFSANALLTVSPKRRDEAGVNGEVAERVEVCMEVAPGSFLNLVCNSSQERVSLGP